MGARPPTLAQSPRRKPHPEELRNLGSAVRGASETLRLGPGEKRLPSKSFGMIRRSQLGGSSIPHAHRIG